MERISKYYNLWRRIKSNCNKYNKEHFDSQINICKEWQTYQKFEQWCVEQCGENLDLFFIRIDETKDYTPENCLFMNSTDAKKFKSKNAVKIEYNGKNLSLTDWERETGISRHILSYRLNAGWTVEDIFNTPVSQNKNNLTNCKKLYNIWCAMIQRCYDKTYQKYKDYGAKGIDVCEEWRNNFHSFEKWALENGYNDNMIINRKDVLKNYSAENCLIISTKEQGKNRSNNHKITYNGKTMNLQDWANEVGIAASTIRKRLKSGWTVENALYTSVEKKHKK